MLNRIGSGLLVLAVCASGPQVLGQIEFFIADRDNDAILRFDAPSGNFIDAFCPSGSGGLDRPVNVEFGPDGHLYVANFGDGVVLRFNGQTGAPMGVFASYSWLEECVELIFRGDYLYVLGNDHHNCVKFNANSGSFVSEFGDPTMRWPHDMVFDTGGKLYVTTENYTQGPIQVWDVETETLLDWFGSEIDGLATGITFGPDGNIYVCDWYGADVLRFNAQTHELMDTFITSGSGGLSGPSTIEFRPDGLCYVSGSYGVYRYDTLTGNFVDYWIPDGTGGLGGARGFIFREPLGDMNCDGTVDFDDINPFVLALSGEAGYLAAYPGCHWLNGDTDGNGTVDFDDINPFIALFGG